MTDPLILHARSHSRGESVLHWNSQATAILVVDMWDRHWCKGATARVGEIAQRMNPVLHAARAKGMTVIHCPSETLDFYKDTSQRHLLRAAPYAPAPSNITRWAHKRWSEGRFPIHDRDGGCFCEPHCKSGKAWTRQIPLIDIAPADGISDSGQEIYNFLVHRGITNLVYMGVHLNMCVLGRPFGIRRMVTAGFHALLCRDLTDTMYNPAFRPFVPHDEGTQRVIAHVERYWCPSILSADLDA